MSPSLIGGSRQIFERNLSLCKQRVLLRHFVHDYDNDKILLILCLSTSLDGIQCGSFTVVLTLNLDQ